MSDKKFELTRIDTVPSVLSPDTDGQTSDIVYSGADSNGFAESHKNDPEFHDEVLRVLSEGIVSAADNFNLEEWRKSIDIDNGQEAYYPAAMTDMKVIAATLSRGQGYWGGDLSALSASEQTLLANKVFQRFQIIRRAKGRRIEATTIEPECYGQPEVQNYLTASFYESEFPLEVAQILQMHAREYIRNGILSDEAITEEGFVSQSIDHARGDNVEYMAAYSAKDGDLKAALRIVRTDDGNVARLPSFERCRFGLTPDAEAYLMRETQSVAHVEIAALCKQKAVDPVAVLELYRDAVHYSIQRGEVWFMGLVPRALHGLHKTFGKNIVQVIGEPQLLNVRGVRPEITLTPVLIKPHQVVPALVRNFVTAAREKDYPSQYNALHLLSVFSDGLDATQLDIEAADIIRSLSAGKYPDWLTG